MWINKYISPCISDPLLLCSISYNLSYTHANTLFSLQGHNKKFTGLCTVHSHICCCICECMTYSSTWSLCFPSHREDVTSNLFTFQYFLISSGGNHAMYPAIIISASCSDQAKSCRRGYTRARHDGRCQILVTEAVLGCNWAWRGVVNCGTVVTGVGLVQPVGLVIISTHTEPWALSRGAIGLFCCCCCCACHVSAISQQK